MDRIIYDIDNTLTLNVGKISYADKPVNSLLKETDIYTGEGFGIAYHTARNMKSFDEDLKKIDTVTKPLISEWLAKNNFPNDQIYIGKPYCGEKGIYVDDRAVNIRNHKLSVKSGLLEKRLYVIITLYNAINSVEDILLQMIELSTICLNLKVLLVDNNSSDGTLEYIEKVSEAYPFFDLLALKTNIGYGGAVQEAISKYKLTYQEENYSLIIAHGNSKYSILDFVKGLAQYEFLDEICFTKRVNRSTLEFLITFTLYMMYLCTMRLKIIDCIGAVRYIPASKIKSINFTNAPTDYRFDLWLSLQFIDERKCTISLPQNNFTQHKSSWNVSLISKLRMIFSYIMFVFQKK